MYCFVAVSSLALCWLFSNQKKQVYPLDTDIHWDYIDVVETGLNSEEEEGEVDE